MADVITYKNVVLRLICSLFRAAISWANISLVRVMRSFYSAISGVHLVVQQFVFTIRRICTWVISGSHSALIRRVSFPGNGILSTTMGERWPVSGVLPRTSHANATGVFLEHVAAGFSTLVP